MNRSNISGNICKISPAPNLPPDIDIINFVYETREFPPEEQLRTSYAMCLVISGRGCYTVAGKTHALARGDLFLLFSAKKYYLHSEDALTYCYISFTGLQLHKLLHRLQLGVLSPVFRNYAMLIPHWQEALQRATQDNLDLIALSTLYRTLSHLAVRDQRTTAGASNKRSDERIPEIKLYIDEHFHEPTLTLDLIAARFGYHPKYISERFKQALGATISQYITDCRMRYAYSLLYEGYVSVTMIAEACGYRDPLYFSRVFTKTYGCSPMAIRKDLRALPQAPPHQEISEDDEQPPLPQA